MLVVRNRRPTFAFGALQREVDDVFRRTFGFGGSAVPAAGSDLEVIPDADGVTVRAELPGVDPAAIAIAVEGRTLTISAERKPAERQNGAYQLRERAHGRFSRTLRLADDLDTATITADAKHGVLTLRIARRAESKPRRIEVQVG